MAEWIVVILLLAAMVGGIMVLIGRWSRERKSQRQFHEEQLKMQILNQSLKNSISKEEIHAVGDEREKRNECGKKMLRILLSSEERTREYVLDPEDHPILGSQKDCTLLLRGTGIGNRQCEFFVYHGDIYVKNLNALNNTVILRKNKRARVDNMGIRICSGDRILAGSCMMQIDLLDLTGRIVQN